MKKRRQETASSPMEKIKGSIREQETNMSCPDRLSQWPQEVRAAFGHVSKPQVWGLILWSAGIALSGTAGITQLSASRRAGARSAGTSGLSTLT